MVNKANMRLWVAALRSGVYEQGVRVMKSVGANGKVYHCPLGVAQEVALRAGHMPAEEIDWYMTSAMEKSIFTEFYGLKDEANGRYVLLETEFVLNPVLNITVLNDLRFWTFDQIADAIEKTFDLLTYDEIFDPEFVPTNETVAT